jgi:hypothetical protein
MSIAKLRENNYEYATGLTRADLEAAILEYDGLQKLGVHLSHCNFGENAGACKYGEDDCPALTDSWEWLGLALQRVRDCEDCGATMNHRGLGQFECWKCTEEETRAENVRLKAALGRIRNEQYTCLDKDCTASVIAGRALDTPDAPAEEEALELDTTSKQLRGDGVEFCDRDPKCYRAISHGGECWRLNVENAPAARAETGREKRGAE